MTIKEMNEKIQKFCEDFSEDYEDCPSCPIHEICMKYGGYFGEGNVDGTIEAYNIITGKTENDNVNHPKHYCRDGGMECIDEMLLVFGKSAVMAYCLLNSWKYRYRAADKNGEEDLKKSDWYIRKYKELKEEVDSE